MMIALTTIWIVGAMIVWILTLHNAATNGMPLRDLPKGPVALTCLGWPAGALLLLFVWVLAKLL